MEEISYIIPETETKKTEEEIRNAKIQALKKEYNIKYFCSLFGLTEKEFFSCEYKPPMCIDEQIKWKVLEPFEKKLFFEKMESFREEIKLLENPNEIYVFLVEKHKETLKGFGKNSKAEELFLRYSRKFFKFSFFKKSKILFGTHFSGNHLRVGTIL